MSDEVITVGSEIYSYCGKCKEPTTHVVLNMLDEESMGKLQCPVCKAKHNYRDPEKVAAKLAAAAAKIQPTPEEIWKAAMEKSGGNCRAYAMTEAFVAGEVIEHPTFGKGVVDVLIDNNKINTIFEDGVKLLMHAQ